MASLSGYVEHNCIVTDAIKRERADYFIDCKVEEDLLNSQILSVKNLFIDYPHEWAVCGGWSIDLHLGKQTREHKDIDIFIWRKNQIFVQRYLLERGWLLEIAHNGELSKWKRNDYIELPMHGIWCKHEDFEPHFIELLLNECNETHYQHRRDISIQLPFGQVIIESEDGIPYLAPQIALLYKSHRLNNDNQHDFEVGFPTLNGEQQKWLLTNIGKLYGGNHKWLKYYRKSS
ncbi:MAG: hypothetical protein AAF846_19805 [Chloroflexota bacterium]